MGLIRTLAFQRVPCPLLAARSRLRARTGRKMTVASSASPQRSCSVAVIGAGAAGLVAARELRAEGHDVVVLEQGQQVGGVWQYDEQTEDDLLGAREQRRRVHSSMYRGLRTNLPREIMAYSDFPFDAALLGPRSVDSRRFCSHEEVMQYLDAFADFFDLKGLVQYNTRVVAVRPQPRSSSSSTHAANGSSLHDRAGNGPASSVLSPSSRQKHQQQGANGDANNAQPEADGTATVDTSPQWQVTVAQGSRGQEAATSSQVYDAVVVCNGHYSVPNLPTVPGDDTFPGLVMHSHNYRTPEPFTGQTVLVVGASNSGEDICREVAEVADRVILCARSWKNEAWATDDTPFGPRANIQRRGMVAQMTRQGGASFVRGAAVDHVDSVIYCTGYRYSFPFLEGTDIVSTADQHVSPLYQHMFPPSVAPTLSFVGLPYKIVPFPQFELQSKLIARLLSGRATLPTRTGMLQHAQAFYEQLQREGVPPRRIHSQDATQFEYNAWLADACGGDVSRQPKWRERMYRSTGLNKRQYPESYRDVWDDAEAAEQAAADTKQLIAQLLAQGAAQLLASASANRQREQSAARQPTTVRAQA